MAQNRETQSPLRAVDVFDRYDPFGFQRMRGVLSDMLGDRPGGSQFAPALDVCESDAEYVITAELPGAAREDLAVELDEGTITIRGEKKQGKGSQPRYMERSYGSFCRSFTLPQSADPEKLEATFQDGVLTLRIPKREETKPRVIAIQ